MPSAAQPRRRSPLWWGIGGFLLGIAFWHAIGFWSFLTALVATSAPSRPQEARSERKSVEISVPGRAVGPARPTRAAPPAIPAWGTTVVSAGDDTPADPSPDKR